MGILKIHHSIYNNYPGFPGVILSHLERENNACVKHLTTAGTSELFYIEGDEIPVGEKFFNVNVQDLADDIEGVIVINVAK